MRVGEAAVAVDVSSERHDEDCCFCNAEDGPPEEKVNEFDDEYEEDSDLDGMAPEGIKFKNDAGKLGTACGGCPDGRSIRLGKSHFDVGVAAHHLIPGNAALKRSDLFASNKYLWIDGNIGYNIDSAANGVRLPGNYAYRPWGADGSVFHDNEGVAPHEYDLAGINVWGAQFHDAHGDYSEFVVSVLDKICEKMDDGETMLKGLGIGMRLPIPDTARCIGIASREVGNIAGWISAAIAASSKDDTVDWAERDLVQKSRPALGRRRRRNASRTGTDWLRIIVRLEPTRN
jgi:hypothetical protein